MAYHVDITAGALKDAEEYHRFILRQSHDHIPADNWFNGLLQAVYSLEHLPSRCPSIPNQEEFRQPLRQLLYASHRIIFRIEPKVVRVLRVYPTSGRPLVSLRQRPGYGKLP